MNTYNVLSTLAGTTKTNTKLQILSDNSSNTELSKVFERALNPTVNYYIKKIPVYCVTSTPSLTLTEAVDELEKLSNRTYTGNDGIEHLAKVLSSVSEEDASIIERIIKRDLRCGVSTATVNKIWEDLIPEYPYMRCSSLKAAKINTWDFSKGVFSQIKSDGRYNNCNVDESGNICLVSRSGNELPINKFKNIVDTLTQYFDKNTQNHGELLIKRNGEILDREIGNGIINSIANGGDLEEGEEVVLHIWDQIPLSESTPGNKYPVKYTARFDNLKRQCEKIPEDNKCIDLIESKLVYSVSEAFEHFEEVLLKGLEGTVLKHPDAIWEDTTSKYQVKLKLEVDDIDLEIVSFKAGNGKNKDLFGSILCKSGDQLLEVNFSGFKDKVRKEISANRESLIGTILTGKANAIMKPKTDGGTYSLFLPRFKTLRDDKTKADTVPEIQAKFESAIENIRKYF